MSARRCRHGGSGKFLSERCPGDAIGRHAGFRYRFLWVRVPPWVPKPNTHYYRNALRRDDISANVNSARMTQLADVPDRESGCCEFESHSGHHATSRQGRGDIPRATANRRLHASSRNKGRATCGGTVRENIVRPVARHAHSSSDGSVTASGSIASLPAISTAWVRLLAPSLRSIAVMCALIVASETLSS